MSTLRWRARAAAGVTVVCVSLTAGASLARAQGTSAAGITGVVKDTSGGVLPGVTVEAASPALIVETGCRRTSTSSTSSTAAPRCR